jgi:hypothetical protein
MELDLGPFSFRCFATRDGHTRYQLAFVTNRTGGDAYRESTLEASVRSDHLLEAVGRQNPADTFTDPDTGVVYYGKFCQTPAGVHVLTAKQVYTKAIYDQAVKAGLVEAQAATGGTPVSPGIPVEDVTAAA